MDKGILAQIYFINPGDINSDGEVGDDDLVLLESYLNGGGELSCPRKQADLNKDGLIDSEDAANLKEILKR